MVLVDANVLIDLLTNDPVWGPWSTAAIASESAASRLAINPIVYAELSGGFASSADLDAALAIAPLVRLGLPYGAAFLAGRAHAAYRRRGGARVATLPDLFIGGHAEADGLALLTRDAARYRTYFPAVRLITP